MPRVDNPGGGSAQQQGNAKGDRHDSHVRHGPHPIPASLDDTATVTRPVAQFVVHEPTAPPIAVVVDSPHSGVEWPADFEPSAPREAILTTWDAFVDELCSGTTSAGGTLVTASFPRAYIDVNRAADDIDRSCWC